MSAITAKSWQCLPQNIHSKLQFWTAVQVLESSPQCELDGTAVCDLQLCSINKEYLYQAAHLCRFVSINMERDFKIGHCLNNT